jgi:spermidine synthase
VNVERAASAFAPERFLPLFLLLFVASGCAALIYEIVWFQLLELVIGSSTISLGILLATYMGGLCLGSLALPRLVSARRHPLIVYGLLELGIGASALALLFGLPSVGALYVAHAEHGLVNLVLRGVLSALMLLPPTMLMGATLPAMARFLDSSPKGVSWLGILYTGNIAGAVFGCLFAGFYLLRIHDMAVATYLAATINLALALIALMLAAAIPETPPVSAQPVAEPPASSSGFGLTFVYIVIGISGLTALGSQVVWTRVLSLLLGPSIYTFSIILAVFLIGLGLGSSFGSFLARLSARPRLALAVCQLLLVAGIGWAAATINGSLPYWPVNPSLAITPWFQFQLDLVRVMWAILPATCLWGASFPLALAAVASPGEDAGRLAGTVYAANTIGAIIGALLFSALFIPAIGTYNSQRLLMGVCLLAGILMLAVLMPDHKQGTASREQPVSVRTGMSLGPAAVIITAVLVWAIPSLPGGLIAFGRELPQWMPLPRLLHAGEGINSSFAVTELEEGVRSFHVSGRPEASSGLHDMRVQRMLGHLPGLIHGKPRSVLIVGFGAGVTAGSFTRYPEIERIVICELEPQIPKVVSTFFPKENYEVLKDPRVEVVHDDARHYLLTTRDHFDIITSDPIHPWIKGAATLYTREYFELVKQHLNPGGMVTQWVPFYESTPEVVKSELATFFKVFPDGIVFANEGEGSDTDTVAFGQASPQPIEPERIQERLEKPDYSRVRDSLSDVSFYQALDLFATYAGRASDLQEWLADAEINTDINLRLHYLAGMGSGSKDAAAIYEELVSYLVFPEDLFVASEETKDQLRQGLTAYAPKQ